MINDKKVLLVMGGFAQLCDIVENAKKKGIYVIVTDYLENSPAKKIADESYMVSITDVNGIVNLCRERNVDGVMNYCIDPGQKPYQQICEYLGLPCYGTEEQFNIMTNKDFFKKECLKYGLDIIPEFLLDANFRKEDVNKLIFPVVIKPADGRASKGFSICYDELGVSDAVNEALLYSKRGKFVVEKFISGQEFVVKYFVCDGEIHLTSMADLYTCYTKEGKRAYIGAQVFPSKYYQLFAETTDDKVRGMIRGMGVKNGAMSFDGFIDDDKFRFFDPSYRMGGAQDWRIVAKITGINISELLTNFALTGTMGDCSKIRELDKGFTEKSSAMLYFLVREGKIGEIKGLEEIINISSVIGYHMSHVEGDVVSFSGTSDHVVMRILMVCNDIIQLKNDITKIQDLVTILDEKGNDMLLPNFDANQI
jgi:biotin carboxylase